MGKAKIDWCGCTINSKELKNQTPNSIFMNRTDDCGYWTINYIHKIAKVIKNNPQNNYVFLTERPDLFIEKCKAIVEDANNGNVFVGVTLTKRKDFERLCYLPVYCRRFVCIDPILEDLGDLSRDKSFLFRVPYVPEVIIIGSESDNEKDRVIPKKEWINNLVKYAENYNKYFEKNYILQKNGWYKVKIFMQDNLRELMGEDFRQDELPWRINK